MPTISSVDQSAQAIAEAIWLSLSHASRRSEHLLPLLRKLGPTAR